MQLEDLFRADPVQSQPEGLVRNVSLHQPFASTSAAASSAEGAFGAASQQTGTNEEYQQVRERRCSLGNFGSTTGSPFSSPFLGKRNEGKGEK